MVFLKQYLSRTFYQDYLDIPSHKPPILRILDLLVIPEILNYTCFDTPIGTSHDGSSLLGCMIVVNLSLNKKLTYLSSSLDEQCHVIQYIQFKSITLSLPQFIDSISTISLIHSNYIQLIPSISSHYTKIVNPNTLSDSAFLCLKLALYNNP